MCLPASQRLSNVSRPPRFSNKAFVDSEPDLLADASLTGNELIRRVVVILVAMGAFEGADVWVANECFRALAGHALAPLYGKRLRQVCFLQPRPTLAFLRRSLAALLVVICHFRP